MELASLIDEAIKEDLPDGDLTTDSLSKKESRGLARLVAKQDLTLSGTHAFIETIKRFDPKADFHWHYTDKDTVLKGQTIATITGNQVQLLKAERIALNFIGHLSGIASLTKQFVARTEGFSTKILDTRKTTPGWRSLEKMAVAHGGGTNHRMNLSDAVMIKENHVALAEGLRQAITEIRSETQAPITIEAHSLSDVKVAVELNVTRILLDNMTDSETTEALQIIPKSIETEASGNMTLERISRIAELGVNFISVGATTHSAPCADISLIFDWKTGR